MTTIHSVTIERALSRSGELRSSGSMPDHFTDITDDSRRVTAGAASGDERTKSKVKYVATKPGTDFRQVICGTCAQGKTPTFSLEGLEVRDLVPR